MGSIIQGFGNLISGGTWQQSGGEIAAQNWNAQQAQIARDFSALEAQKNRDFNAEQARVARDFSAMEAQKNRDFQERMSSTAYSRAMADIKSQGINPYAVLSWGSASTPGGSSAQSFSASGQNASSHSASGSFQRQFDNTVLSAMKIAGSLLGSFVKAGVLG